MIATSRPRTSSSAVAGRQHVEPAEDDLPRGHPRRRVEDAHERVGGHRFTRAALADQRHGLAAVNLKPTRSSACTMPLRVRNSMLRIVNGQQAAASAHVRLRGSTMSRNPSPIRLKENTAAIRRDPGRTPPTIRPIR